MSNKLIILVLITIGLLLRVLFFNSYGFNHDEELSVLIANGQKTNSQLMHDIFTNLDYKAENTLQNVIRSTINDNGNSVLFNITLHFWLKVFGNSTISARSLSVLFGILLIPLSYLFSLRLFKDNKTALFITLLISINPLFITYAHHSRAYTMATFFTLLSTYYFYLIISNKTSNFNFILYTSVTLISLLTHYLTIYIFISHLIAFILFNKNRIVWIKYIGFGIITVALFGLWLIKGGFEGMEILNSQNEYFSKQASIYKEGDNPLFMPANFKNIITGWFQVWLQMFGNHLQNFGLRIREIVILILLPFSFLIYLFLIKRRYIILKKELHFLLIMTFTQIAFATFLAIKSGHCISFQPLYANFATPYAMILLGYSILFSHHHIKLPAIIISSLIILIMIVSPLPTYMNYNNQFEEGCFHKTIAKQIAEQYKPNNIVTIKSAFDAKRINLYFTPELMIFQQIDTSLNATYSIK